MIRCLVVDDDAQIRDALAQFLAGFDIAVQTAADGAAMRAALARGGFDVVVLDVMLPDESGLVLCKWVHDTSALPVIMLTAQGDPVSRVVGLEMGADDYLGKPFEPRELVARIQAVLRRAAKGAGARAQAVRFEGWLFDRLRRQLVSPQGVALPLSSAEYRLLAASSTMPGACSAASSSSSSRARRAWK